MASGQVYESDKKSCILDLDMEPVTAIDEGFWNWVEH